MCISLVVRFLFLFLFLFSLSLFSQSTILLFLPLCFFFISDFSRMIFALSQTVAVHLKYFFVDRLLLATGSLCRRFSVIFLWNRPRFSVDFTSDIWRYISIRVFSHINSGRHRHLVKWRIKSNGANNLNRFVWIFCHFAWISKWNAANWFRLFRAWQMFRLWAGALGAVHWLWFRCSSSTEEADSRRLHQEKSFISLQYISVIRTKLLLQFSSTERHQWMPTEWTLHSLPGSLALTGWHLSVFAE